VERHIVIPGHDNLRTRERIQKHAGRLKLLRARTLRKVSGDGQQIRLDTADNIHQRFVNREINPAEVKI
jgi:hypothetical protein